MPLSLLELSRHQNMPVVVLGCCLRLHHHYQTWVLQHLKRQKPFPAVHYLLLESDTYIYQGFPVSSPVGFHFLQQLVFFGEVFLPQGLMHVMVVLIPVATSHPRLTKQVSSTGTTGAVLHKALITLQRTLQFSHIRAYYPMELLSTLEECWSSKCWDCSLKFCYNTYH